MSSRTLVRLLAAAGILIGLWLLVSLLAGDDDQGASTGPDDWSAFFGRLSPESVQSVRIEDPGGVRTLRRDDGRWRIEGFPADSGSVARFWSAISDTATPELVARNPENHPRMGLVADSAITIAFATASDTLRLLVGGSGPGDRTAYIRRPESDAVYLSRRNLRAYAERTVEDWRDRTVVAIDTSAVVQIDVERPGESYALVRNDSTWTILAAESGAPAGPTDPPEPTEPAEATGRTEPGDRAEPGLVQSLLAGLAELPAAGFVQESERPSADAATIVVTALAGAGDTLTVVRAGELQVDWWAAAAGSETVFRLPAFRAEQLAPALEAIRAR